MKLINKLKSIYFGIYFLFRNKLLFKDGYGLNYYLYKNTRPHDTFNLGVRSDDITVLYFINKILNSSSFTNSEEIHCMDIGGYIGVVSLMMSKSLEKSKKKWKIHVFEPNESSFKKLKENISLDPFCKNILLNQIAISDKSGNSKLRINHEDPGQTKLENNNFEFKDKDCVFKNVKTTTLSNYIVENNIKKINICKIDTEGSDYVVLKGLYEFLEKKIVDFFIFEYQLNTFEKIKKKLCSNEYSIFFMIRNENLIIKSLENYPTNCKSLLNCVAVNQEQKNNFIKKFNID